MTIHKLTLPTGMPVGPVNAYLVEGEQLTLIDTGPRSDETFAVLEQAVSAQGYALSDLKRIVITHTHPDHFGLVRRLVDLSGAEIWTHPYNAGWFNDLDTMVERRGAFTLQVFRQAGVPQSIVQEMGRGGRRFGRMLQAASASHWM